MPIFRSFDGTELFWCECGAASPGAAPRADVILIHGYGEHAGRYARLGGELAQKGFRVRAVDLRGHGKSGGRRGFAMSFSEYIRDLDSFVAEAHPASDTTPLVFVAHSFGALVGASYVIARKTDPSLRAPAVAALVLSSPFFGLALKVPAWKKKLAEVTSSLFPTLSLPTGIAGDAVSHDPAIARAYETDPLVNKKATTRWFTETVAAQARIFANASALTVPVLVMQGGADSVADVAQTRAVFARIGAADKTLRIYDGQYHEVFNESEPARAQIVADLCAWLDAHV